MHVVSVTLCALLMASIRGGLAIPDSSNEVEFSLYRRTLSNKKVKNSLFGLPRSFNPKQNTYFIIHGWNGDISKGWTQELIKALLKKEDANVFTVDWRTWAKTGNYLAAKAKCEEAGGRLSSFIRQLEMKAKATRKTMHLIGHSLGGQVAGFAGARLQSPKLARITGLDTSGIGFNCFRAGDCLDPSDAEFVDEIHTLVSALSKGHVDFYPIPANPLKPSVFLRSHFLGADYFIKSIQAGKCAFKSTQCNSQLSFLDGKCKNNAVNRLGFYATKPSSKPPNRFYIDIDINKPC